MGEKIRLTMNDWLYNAGMVGLYNILKHAGDSVQVKEQYLEFDINHLEDFEEKYFSYMIDKYEHMMIFSSIRKKLEFLVNNNIDNNEDVFQKEHKEDIKYIKDKLKNSAYKNIMSNLTKDELSKCDRKFFENLLGLLGNEKKEILKKECIGFYDQKAKVSKSPNAIVDKFINTNMLDLGNSCNTLLEYLKADKSKYRFECFNCGRPIWGIDKGLSFLTNIYFDTSRKTSHVWNFVSDIEICPICALTYYCIPAGFIMVQGKGIYINENTRLVIAININNRVKTEILKEHEVNRNLTYRGLVHAINEQANDKIKYELADIQVVKFEGGKYQFNILSRKMLNVITSSKEDLNSLISGGFNEIKTYFNIYELVIDRILNNQNLFTLIHKLLVFKLSSPKESKFGMGQVVRVMKINLRIMEGMGYMEKVDKDIIKQANASGYYLREDYKGKGAKDKLNGIAYRLLNALKTSNKNMFMDTLLNCYLYVQKTVPNIFLEALKDEEKYKTIGYAFVSGLIEGKESNENEKKNGGNE